MRQFKMQNAKGQEFDLMRKDALFINPAGLGIDIETEYDEVQGNYREYNRVITRAQINGVMSFEGYEQFSEFAAFLRYPPFEFYYKPEDKWYKKRCAVARLEKSEISQDTCALDCELYLAALTGWRSETQMFWADGTGGVGKVYNYSYPYTYTGGTVGTARIRNNSGRRQSMRITIIGRAETPTWALSQGGILIGSGRCLMTVDKNEKLVIDSNPLNMEMAVYRGENQKKENVYQRGDFETERFLYLPEGESILVVTNGSGEPIKAVAEIQEEYDLV
ncbi:MAG: hypothetical protein K2N01_13370 [Lachnospiraceae bacterium]|nr:hypothetical protein [Lachnospiraceae bacterium]